MLDVGQQVDSGGILRSGADNAFLIFYKSLLSAVKDDHPFFKITNHSSDQSEIRNFLIFVVGRWYTALSRAGGSKPRF